VKFDPQRVDISLAGIPVCRDGLEHPFSERVVHRKMLASFVPVVVDLNAGRGVARVWTCDFTTEYIHINASYRT
jgi:glutamate N-acetyltransferase/amino-acid N-acetyltransferase